MLIGLFSCYNMNIPVGYQYMNESTIFEKFFASIPQLRRFKKADEVINIDEIRSTLYLLIALRNIL